jgi:predicted transcriptional regulator
MKARIISDEQIIDLHRRGLNQSQIGEALGVSNVAIHKRLKKILVMQNLEKLTKKEQRFCLAVAEGKSRTQAVMEAYDVSSRESAKALQNTLSEKAEIQESITAIMDLQGLTRSSLIKVLKGHIFNETDPNVSLRALDIGFKLSNSYPAQKNINLNANIDISPIDLSKYKMGN